MVEFIKQLLAEAVRRKSKIYCIYVDPTSYDSLVMEIAKENPSLFKNTLFNQEVNVADLSIKNIPIYCDRDKQNGQLFIELKNSEE